MNIAVCFKIVPSDQGIKAKADRSLDISNTEIEVSSFDLNAIEAAVNAASAIDGSKVVAVTVNNELVDNAKMRKTALSRGPAEMIAVKDDRLAQGDTYATASTLAAAVKKVDDCQLVICGEGSADMYNQQVGSMLGFMLGYNTVNGVSKITPVEGGVVVERSLKTGVEVLKVEYPAALSVTSDINMPRIPSMKDILGAGKKPFSILNADEAGAEICSKSEIVSILAPAVTDRRKEIYDGSDAAAVESFKTAIAKIL